MKNLAWPVAVLFIASCSGTVSPPDSGPVSTSEMQSTKLMPAPKGGGFCCPIDTGPWTCNDWHYEWTTHSCLELPPDAAIPD